MIFQSSFNGRNKVGECKVWPVVGMGHLLTKGVQDPKTGVSRLVAKNIDIVAPRIRRPESHDRFRREPILVDDAV